MSSKDASEDGASCPFGSPRRNTEPLSSSRRRRRRIAVACTNCRFKKSRCDGQRPSCGYCVRKKIDCAYETFEATTNLLIPRDRLSNMQHQLQSLEAAVIESHEHIDSIQYALQLRSGHVSRTTSPSSRSSAVDAANAAKQAPEADVGPVPPDSVTAIFFPDESLAAFFGPSSCSSLMRIVRRIAPMLQVDGLIGANPEQAAIPDPIQQTSRAASIGTDPIEDTSSSGTSPYSVTDMHAIPSGDSVRKLLNIYFSRTNLLFPIFRQATIFDIYKRIEETGDVSFLSNTWLGVFNMILAIAAMVQSTSLRQQTLICYDSSVFFSRAQQLAKSEAVHAPTVETVQYLLLASMYLQCTPDILACWTTHGQAVKTAFAIGLHSRAHNTTCQPFDREIRSRCWFGCVVLDRQLSAMFGRPSLIHRNHIKLDLPSSIASHPTEVETTSLMYFNSVIYLYHISWSAVESLYDHNLACDDLLPESRLFTAIVGLLEQVQEWKRCLPQQLALRTTSTLPTECKGSERITERFHLSLTIQYLYVQLLIYHPALLNSLRGEVEKSLSSILASQCLHHAEELILLNHRVVTDPELGQELLSVSWFTQCSTFKAALSVFSSAWVLLKNNDKKTSENLERATSSLMKAIECLEVVSPCRPDASQLILTVRQLSGLLGTWNLNQISVEWNFDVAPELSMVGNGTSAWTDITGGWNDECIVRQLETEEVGMGWLY